jgi:hypothetical protein
MAKSGDSIWRLRLKYEHSRAECCLCGQVGIVGVDIKLLDSRNVEHLGTLFEFRCSDPVRCHQRANA